MLLQSYKLNLYLTCNLPYFIYSLFVGYNVRIHPFSNIYNLHQILILYVNSLFIFLTHLNIFSSIYKVLVHCCVNLFRVFFSSHFYSNSNPKSCIVVNSNSNSWNKIKNESESIFKFKILPTNLQSKSLCVIIWNNITFDKRHMLFYGQLGSSIN